MAIVVVAVVVAVEVLVVGAVVAVAVAGQEGMDELIVRLTPSSASFYTPFAAYTIPGPDQDRM